MPQKPMDFSQMPDPSEDYPELGEEERWHVGHMLARERALGAIFGEAEPPGQLLAPADRKLVEGWPGGGIFQFPPQPDRAQWHYVTHGLAHPTSQAEVDHWKDQPTAYSGFGIELVISTAHESEWAPMVLLELVSYLLFVEGAQLIMPGDRIPCSALAAYADADTTLTHLLATQSLEYASELNLPAGRCTLVHLVGVTDGEMQKAKSMGADKQGSDALVLALQEMGVGWQTAPSRRCLTDDPAFDIAWTRALAAED